MKNIFANIIAAIILMFSVQASYACTTFLMSSNGSVIQAKNVDWIYDKYFVILHPRNQKKIAQWIPKQLTKLKWKSKYGSVTFSGLEPEGIMGGTNEVGLTISASWLSYSKYPRNTNDAIILRIPTITNLQIIQYLLDSCSTVHQVINVLPEIHVIALHHPDWDGVPTLHYFISDKTGGCAVVEYLHGNLEIMYGHPPLISVLTNTDYLTNLNAYYWFLSGKKIQEFMKYQQPSNLGENTENSIERFIITAKDLSHWNHKTPMFVYAKHILSGRKYGVFEDMKKQNGKVTIYPTQLSIIYNVTKKVIWFRKRNAVKWVYVNLAAIPFKKLCHEKVLLLTLKLHGDITNLL